MVTLSVISALKIQTDGVPAFLGCTRCYSTGVIPFRVNFQPGIPLSEQVIYAAKKAIISGRMNSGDPFPSVRTLSKEFKINPNTAHKVVSQLIATGLLETRPGIGTVVAVLPAASPSERMQLLGNEIEQLVVEAKKLGISSADIIESIADHWERLENTSGKTGPGGRGRR